MNFKKICIIKKKPTLKDILKVLFFLGFMNFYRRFIKKYLKVAINLTNLTKKDTDWI